MSERKPVKVIHVHFLNGRKNYYFGSISAIFQKFSEEEIGCTEEFLRHTLTADDCSHLSPLAFITRSRLITCHR